MNEGFHAVKVQGLLKAHHRPKMEDLFFLGLRKKTRDQRDRHRAEMPDAFQDFLPIHNGHRRIKKNKVVMIGLDLAETFLAVQRAIDLMAFLLEGLPELFTDHFLVVDDQ